MPKYTPLRDWACPSYDAITGRAASSSDENMTHAQPSTQMPPAGFYGRDRARTQIATPVRKRPFSQSR
jgi:hypothetical protein